MIIIKRNAIKCKICGDIIESRSRHDYQECSCGSVAIDGGRSYVRVCGDINNAEFMTEYEEVPGCHVKVYLHYGGTTEFDIPLSELKKVTENYEEMWHSIEAINEYGDLIYQSDGIKDKNG